MLSMVENLQREMRILDLKDSDVLKIGSSHIPTSSILYRAIVEFKKMYPNVYVIYEINDTGTISYMVENEIIDLGFVGAVVNGDLQYKSFSGDELVLVCSKDFPVPDTISLGELKNIPLILNQKESGVRKFLEDRFREYGLQIDDLNVISEIGLPEALINVIKLGMGCAFIPSILLQKECSDDDVKKIEIRDFSAHREYYLVTKKGKTLPKIAKEFLDYFISSLSR